MTILDPASESIAVVRSFMMVQFKLDFRLVEIKGVHDKPSSVVRSKRSHLLHDVLI